MNERDGRDDRRVDVLNYFSNIEILLNIKKQLYCKARKKKSYYRYGGSRNLRVRFQGIINS